MKKLKSNNNLKLIAVAVVLLLAISIGYAALSTTLSINGTANIASSSWLVYFTNVQVKDGSVTAITAPSTSGTSTTTLTWAVNLQTPGEFYEYNVDVKNDGTIDAMIGSLSNTSLNTNQAKYLNYTVTYSDGASIEQYDKLISGETVTLKVRVDLKTDLNPEDLPGEASAVTLTYTSDYVQADENAKDRNENNQIDNDPLKVSVNDLRAGDEVYYTLKNSSNPIECIVLWDSISTYGQSGVQIITKDSIAKVILGNENIANSVESYNNAIQTLNNKANEYLNLDLSPEKVEINGTFINAARCIGSIPNNPTFESGYRENSFEGYQVKNKDSNCAIDLEQMNSLGITIAGNNSDYWLASRYIFSWNHNQFGINGVNQVGESDLNGFSVLFDTLGQSQPYTIRSFESEKGFRPVFTLKKDIKIKKVPQG